VSTALQPAQQKSGLAPTYPCDPLQSENRVYSAGKVKARYGPEPPLNPTIPLASQPLANLLLLHAETPIPEAPLFTSAHLHRLFHKCFLGGPASAVPKTPRKRGLQPPKSRGISEALIYEMGCTTSASPRYPFSLLSLTRHFSKSAFPRTKTGCSVRFRFRAREQTAASRSIFAALFALPVEAARLPFPQCPAR
jgi:hypothetical protein